MTEIIWLTADELASRYRKKTLSPVDAIDASLARIAEVDALVNSFVTVTDESARAEAEIAAKDFEAGDELNNLRGIPISVKDLTDTAGVRTTYGSPLFQNHVPTEDALAWDRLKKAGTILVGKTTTPEFGLLGVTHSKLTGATSTPWKIGYNSGGSSGGSAASVAAGIVPIAWGSDGGGSIRVPSALCGVVGFKPTTGYIPHRNNEDPDSTEGPIARSVLDVAVMMDAAHGRHSQDRFSTPRQETNFSQFARSQGDLSGMRIAASVDLDQGTVDHDVQKSFEESIAVLEKLGAVVTPVSPRLPDTTDFFVQYWGPEFVRFVDEMDRDGQEIWEFIRKLANRARSLTALEASAALRGLKTELYNGYGEIFENYDAIVTPTTPIVARPHEADAGAALLTETGPIDPGVFELHRLTEPPSHAGLPAISLPCGLSTEGLPIGLQIVTPMYEDGKALFIASRFEQATEWHNMHPVLISH